MSEFNYGDPIPLPIDRQKGKRKSDKLAAVHYAKKLSELEGLYVRGGNGVTEGLTLFDREVANFRGWQG